LPGVASNSMRLQGDRRLIRRNAASLVMTCTWVLWSDASVSITLPHILRQWVTHLMKKGAYLHDRQANYCSPLCLTESGGHQLTTRTLLSCVLCDVAPACLCLPVCSKSETT
jgi:hypothetical protein